MHRAIITLLIIGTAHAARPAPLELETRIPLGDVHGRIDHMAFDAARQRLFVAELGNDSVGVVDLRERKVLHTIGGLREPQGLGYAAATDTLYVANAGDGTVRMYKGADLRPAGRISLGEDADNVRLDEPAHRLFVGYGTGALAIIDLAGGRKTGAIALHGHPESFQMDPAGQRIYVNVPDSKEIAVLDRSLGRQVASWATGTLRANFPMALDPARTRVVVVFREPAAIGVFDSQSGHLLSRLPTCGDSDDAFLDARRDRLYVSCGEGVLETFAREADGYKSLGRIGTASGARTSFFASQIDRLLLAVRATASTPASIWVYKPNP